MSKMPNVTWPKGTFVETIKEWKKLWFYITEPRDATWAAAPEFKSGAPMRLTSWIEKGQNWSSSNELIALQTRIQSMVDKNIKLVNVIQVMLVRRILPCQSRACPFMGIRSGGAPDLGKALRNHARRYLEVDLQGQRDAAGDNRGPRARPGPSCQCGKYFTFQGAYFTCLVVEDI